MSSNAIFPSDLSELFIAIRIVSDKNFLLLFFIPQSKRLFLPLHSCSLVNSQVVNDGVCGSPVVAAPGCAWEEGTAKA